MTFSRLFAKPDPTLVASPNDLENGMAVNYTNGIVIKVPVKKFIGWSVEPKPIMNVDDAKSIIEDLLILSTKLLIEADWYDSRIKSVPIVIAALISAIGVVTIAENAFAHDTDTSSPYNIAAKVLNASVPITLTGISIPVMRKFRVQATENYATTLESLNQVRNHFNLKPT